MKIKILIKQLEKNKYLVLLAIISVALLASVVRYGLRTWKIPEWDEQHYMRMATEFYRLIRYNFSLNTPHEMLQIVPFRQPGYPLLMLPFLLIFGLSKAYFWGIFTNGLLYIATIFGIYFVSNNFLSRTASFLAAIIFAFYGWTLLHLHLTFSETASSAFAIWAVLFLIKSNFFKVRKYSLLFGLLLGFSLLIKWTTVVFILGPLFYVIYKILRDKSSKKKETLNNIFLAFIITLVISFYPYFQNYYWVFQYFYGHRSGGPMWQIVSEQERNPISSYSLTYYLNTFSQLGIFHFILIVTGFILAIHRKSNLKPILLSVLISYFFFVFSLLKAERHIIPIYPYLAILSASVIDYIKNKNLKFLLIAFILILSGFSFLGSVWGKGPMRESLASLSIELHFGQLKKIYLTTISSPPYIYKISGKEILDYIGKDSKSNGIKNPQILSLFYFRPLDEPLMTYNLYNQEKTLSINNFIGTTINKPESQAGYLLGVIKNSDYILTKSGQRIDEHFPKENYETIKALIDLFDNHFKFKDYYEEKTKIWIYQDSSEVTIFKKKREIPSLELEEMRLKLVEILKLYE